MISLKKCREILGEKGKDMTDEQLESIRTLLISMAKINLKLINNKKDEEGRDNV